MHETIHQVIYECPDDVHLCYNQCEQSTSNRTTPSPYTPIRILYPSVLHRVIHNQIPISLTQLHNNKTMPSTEFFTQERTIMQYMTKTKQ
jgi:hypothetical protein